MIEKHIAIQLGCGTEQHCSSRAVYFYCFTKALALGGRDSRTLGTDSRRNADLEQRVGGSRRGKERRSEMAPCCLVPGALRAPAWGASLCPGRQRTRGPLGGALVSPAGAQPQSTAWMWPQPALAPLWGVTAQPQTRSGARPRSDWPSAAVLTAAWTEAGPPGQRRVGVGVGADPTQEAEARLTCSGRVTDLGVVKRGTWGPHHQQTERSCATQGKDADGWGGPAAEGTSAS